ncbi:hypothetical protein AN639_08435 [Candidatus Epulonipiscium fishelsonii]|uniref:Uncharacterized protein n=1 Tax=Candidatus Epulonipiscium fishelsonii TaxID=77094 RepID=A0ACC8XGD3_9FIRM|nr:hypothetical protein AN639_08435 [Epulopiscium sp. SCG-B05WGA-EpuloA1]ONI42485.1 hypothetical protein AN396_14220 [Epulopiscium sp. SCG-B11WGA-EpuloA1]
MMEILDQIINIDKESSKYKQDSEKYLNDLSQKYQREIDDKCEEIMLHAHQEAQRQEKELQEKELMSEELIKKSGKEEILKIEKSYLKIKETLVDKLFDDLFLEGNKI